MAKWLGVPLPSVMVAYFGVPVYVGSLVTPSGFSGASLVPSGMYMRLAAFVPSKSYLRTSIVSVVSALPSPTMTGCAASAGLAGFIPMPIIGTLGAAAVLGSSATAVNEYPPQTATRAID